MYCVVTHQKGFPKLYVIIGGAGLLLLTVMDVVLLVMVIVLLVRTGRLGRELRKLTDQS